MLQAAPRFDSKWMKTNIQTAFTTEGLFKLWAELVKDGEVADRTAGPGWGGASNKDRRDNHDSVPSSAAAGRKSPFDAFLEEWTWGQEPSAEQLREALQTLVTEQQELSQKAAQSTQSLSRLSHRLVVLERYFIAVSRKGLPSSDAPLEEGGEGGKHSELPESQGEGGDGGGVQREGSEATAVKKRTSEQDAKMVTEALARVGARTALSFVFAFLKRVWQSGEDSELCTEVFRETLDILQELPVALLFDTATVSRVWVDVVDRSMAFLGDICKGLKVEGEKGIPLEDKRAALALLLELSLQRGTLERLLDVVLLLLDLSQAALSENKRVKCGGGSGGHDGDVGGKSPQPAGAPSNEEESCYPLVPFLRRLSAVPTPQSPHHSSKKTDEECVSPTKCYLDYLALPNDDSTKMDLRQVATITLSHLDRLAQPYSSSDPVSESTDQHPCLVLHWGRGQREEVSGRPTESAILQELGAKQVVSSDKHTLVLTMSGSVYSLQTTADGDFTATPVCFPGDVEVVQLAHHPEGRHFLALSHQREVFAWGSGENGQLGLNDIKSQDKPARVSSMNGKNIIHISAGGSHSAAVSEAGALYTWGRGSYGRLGHGNVEDKSVPTLVQGLVGHKIVDVDCSSGDAHTLALEDNGCVWSWGDGDFGKLGRGGSESCKVPKIIPSFGAEIAKVRCGAQFSVALSRDGKLYTWGSAEFHHLGHGDEEHVRIPREVAGLAEVVAVAVGSQHCLALTASGEVYGWGKNSTGEVNGSREAVAVPTLIPGASKLGVVYVSCGTHESFACCRRQVVPLGTRLPFCLDVSTGTFERIDLLLRGVCEGLEASQPGANPPSQNDKECMAVAVLNLLKLQLQAAISEGLSPSQLGLSPGSALLKSLKNCVVEIARTSTVLEPVQRAAQAVLRSGWVILLPTVSERASALSQLLPSGEAAVSERSLPAGHQFMLGLLVESLMTDRGLENALVTAIAYEVADPSAVLKPGAESSVPLLHLVQQLIGNATSRQLASIKQLLELVERPQPEEGGKDSSAMELLLLFQRLLVGIIYSHITAEDKDRSSQTRGAIAVLMKYIAMLHEHASQLLPLATKVAATSPLHFSRVADLLQAGPTGILLPELAVGLVLLQLRLPLQLVESHCIPLLGELVGHLDQFNRLAPGAHRDDEEDLAWPDAKGPESARLVTQAEFVQHNQEEGGSWLVIHGKVYDAEHLAVSSCRAENLGEYIGRDATKAFETCGHSDHARELAKQLCVGELVESCATLTCPLLVDTERVLALLQGLRACFMVQSIPVLPEEEDNDKWLSMEIFSSGIETQPLSCPEAHSANTPEATAKSFQRQTSMSFDVSRSFICGLMSAETEDEKVTMFVSIVQRYCRQRNLIIALSDQIVDHPIERFGRLFIACLIKLHDLVPVALNVIEQEGGPNNEQDSTLIQLPASLADICKLVYDAKVSLVKAHQESSCSYEEVCRDPIARCCFMIDSIRSPMLNVINVLHRNRIQGVRSRWQRYARRVLEWSSQAGKVAPESPSADGRADTTREKVLPTQHAIDVKQMKEVSSWDQVNLEIASSRKFKWLRERMGGSSPHTTLLNQIKNFVLTDEVDVKSLQSTLRRQVHRASLRLEGVQFLLGVLEQDTLLPSVKYATMCGWLGVFGAKSSYSPCVVRPHYLSNVERIPPVLQTFIELHFHRLEAWAHTRLRSAVCEAEQALKQASSQPEDEGSDAIGSLPSSRFIVAALAMLTSEHEAVDLSLLLSNGVLGLSQTVLRLSGSSLLAEEEEEDTDGATVVSVSRSNFSGADLLKRFTVGTRVVRGPDWKWADQNGPAPGEGTIISEVGSDGWVRVRWDSGSVNSYRMGKEDKFDLALAPSELQPKAKEPDSKEVAADAQITVGMAKPLPASSLSTSLVLQSCLCLLRSVVVGAGLHSQHLHRRTMASLAALLHHITQCNKKKDLRNQSALHMVAAEQHETWATFGFLRGVATIRMCGRAFCSPQWIDLMMGIISGASPIAAPHPLPKSIVQQVLTIRLLRAVLPSWEVGSHTPQQQRLVEALFSLLGEVLVLCSSPFRSMKPGKTHKAVKKLKLHASLTASDSSTIAEEVVVLLRRLHPLPAWNRLINHYISSSLQAIPNIILPPERRRRTTTQRSLEQQLVEDVRTHGPVLAVLTVIGGLDSRPRLGGLVQHEELGTGTIAKVESKSKVVVLFHGRKTAKLCTLSSVKPLPVLSFRVDHLPMSETVMGIWSSLVRLAGTSGGAMPSAALPASPFQPPSLTQTPAKLLPPPQEQDMDAINIPLLRQQQIRLGLLKAARVLFSQQQNLRQIMACPTSAEEEDQYSLFQQLLSAATRPSPIKAMFSRDELEAAAVSVCQYLASEVHKPVLAVHEAEQAVHEAEQALEAARTAAPKKRPTAKKSPSSVGPAPSKPAKLTEPQPPPPVVTQIMEMGFPKRHVEYAMQTTQSSNLERLVSWLLDHTNLEVPELDSAHTPTPPPAAEATPTTEEQATKAEEGASSDSSSDSSEVSECSEDEVDDGGDQKFKGRDDFPNNLDDYARYVRDNISVGMMVKCCEAYEEVRLGDIGRVMKVDNDGLHDLNVQANWQQKGGTYWVRFGHCELLGDMDAAGVLSFKPGDKVRVKRTINTPKYKWGSVTHQSVGVVRSINRNGTDVCVDFPEQSNWTGLISEMETVPGIHPRHRCNGCSMFPIEGSRYHCQVCADFDFCQNCFDKGQAHNHAFERTDDQGQAAVYVGSPRSRRRALRRKKKKMHGGSVVMDWDQIVRHLSTSSNESQAHRLIDGIHTTCWQSSGPQGKHWIRLEIQRNILIEQLTIQVEPADSSYMPSVIAVLGGHTIGGLKELKQCTISTTCREFILVSGLTEYYGILEIAIRSCKSGGIDTKVHGVSVIGRVDMNEDEVAASFSFLTVDEGLKDSGLVRKHRRKAESGFDDNSNKVFVWGLNDKDQLGSALSESKIKNPFDSKALAKLLPIQLAGGAKTLFIVSQDGKVYVCGEGTNGRLGVGGCADVPAPKIIADLSTYVVRKVAVSTGGRHAMALTADGKVFSWGDGEYGQLGHGDCKSYDRPKMIENLQGKHVRDIACGSGHSAAITSNGELYTWGQGEHGRLGHGDLLQQTKPKLVRQLEKHRVVCVACGSRDAQTLAATEKGHLWAWGDGSYGKLGKDIEGSEVPIMIKDFGCHNITQLECGAQFSVLLTKDGKVYTWGKGDYYRLGSDNTTHVKEPQHVELLTKKVVQIAVGSLHCLALCDNGEVYTWGDNEHGQQGIGSTICNRKPQQIVLLKEHRITKIACGSSHSIAFATGTPAATGEFTSVSFQTTQDALGTSLTSGKATEDTFDDDQKRPSLTKIILSLNTPAKQQQALGHIQTALQIAYARDAIVSSLGGVALAAQEQTEELDTEQGDTVEITGVIPPSPELTNSLPFGSKSDSGDSVLRKVVHIPSGLDDFTSLLTIEDARVMVDLLKLAVARRVGEKGKETLGTVLTAMGKANPEVATMLMELCISELEDVSREPQLNETPQPVIEESPHPYPDDVTLTNTIHMAGAEALIITFDTRCSTERRHDMLVIKDGGGAAIAVKSGRDAADWSQDVRVIGDELTWTFKSDGSVNGWGFRFTVQPIMPKKSFIGKLLSDRVLQSRPSIDLVTCLLDFQLGQRPSRDSISRLGAALASCAQLNMLDASQRMWAIQHLRKLINSYMNAMLVAGTMGTCCPLKQSTGATMSSFCTLVRGLPDALLKQYNYELTHVTGGSQLLHSPFFQSMVALACDLEMDAMDCCNDATKWAWFTQYCIAARMAKALQNRTPIPAKCLAEINERIETLKQPDEPCSCEHESCEIFKQEHDEQLLAWTQRYPKDWSIPLGNSFSIYGWGHNHRGQLGGVEGNKVKTPRLCENFSELSPLHICGGEQTLFAITQDGKVYASGYGAYGRLGVGGSENIATPTVISSLSTRGTIIKKMAVHSGGKHCLAITSLGELYAWGEGDDGKLGLGGTANLDTPHLVESLKGKRVKDIACGSSHSACILEDGSLYTWGKGRYGRLGHNDHEPQYKPKQVSALKGEQITCVACGSGDAQTLCASANGNVYSWGDGDYGKLGRGGNEGCKIPKKVDALTGKGVIKLLCGSQFSMALTDQGHVYTWGKGDYHRLGHGDDSHQRTPKRVMGALSTQKVVDIACGSLHCVVCTEDGKIYSWGDNDEGQIGNDTTTAVQSPEELRIPDQVHVDHVACGSAHSVAWSSVRRKVVCRLPERVPMEFSHLQAIPMQVLRNRLILLHHFSNLFCKSLTLFGLQPRHSDVSSGHEANFEAYDRLRSILLLNAKESAFKRVIKATMTQGKQHGPVIELNRIQVKRSRSRGGMAGPDGLKSVFGQMCSKWSILSQEDLLLPHRIWKVKFIGESVDDCGGGYSESIAEMCDELQNGSVPLLIQTPNGREDTGVNRDCFIINPAACSHIHLNMFRFLGTLLGIAVRTGSPVNLCLAPPVWKQLVGMSLTLSDLSEIDSDYVQGLLYIRDNPEAFTGIEFTAPSATGKEVRLHHSWTELTMENCQEYVRLATHMRLHEFDSQVQAMRDGMAKVCPVPLFSLFTGPELEMMVCGSREISISLLKSVTTYKGIEHTAPLSRWFWEVMESYSQAERSLFLRFVWGRTRLPRTAADFRGRNFVLQVLDKYHPPDYYLPESYTCFFLLKIPRYSCKPVLEEKLRYAINFCKSIDTDDYARVNLQEGLMDDEEDDLAAVDALADA